MTRVPIRGADSTGQGSSIAVGREAPPDRAKPRFAPVTHDSATIAFYTRGHARVEQHGEWTVREGDVWIIPAGDPHRMLEMHRPEYWGLALRTPCFPAPEAAELLAPIERVRDGGSSVVHVPAARHGFLEELFRELENNAAARGPSATAVQRSLLTLILAEVDRAGRDDARPTQPRSSVVVDSLRFIERNCLRRLTLNEVAAAVGRTPAYVTTALTRSTGRSAVDWITSGRMAEARRLLIHSDERIDVIAERVGYADATHFIRMFRRSHGVTPSAWRAAPPAHRGYIARR